MPLKQPKTDVDKFIAVSELQTLMSELILLREEVAQAERERRRFTPSLNTTMRGRQWVLSH